MKRLVATVLLTHCLIASLASAQDVVPPSDNYLEELVVTAQKREESLLKVPMAVSALSDVELKERGINAITDLQFAVPGLTMREDGPGSNTIFLRGIVNQYGAGPVVGQYLDEIPVSLTAYDQLDIRTLDLERIEVLKGPQGTLYGQGSVAGTVRYITKKPVLDQYEGEIGFGAGVIDDGDQELALSGVLNVPVVEDRFAVRLAARVQQDGGWQDQPEAGIEDGNDQDLVNVRANALWLVNDGLDVGLTLVYHRNESELGLGFEDRDRTVFVAGDPATRLIPKVQKYMIANLTVNAELGFGILTSSTSYIDNDHEYPFAYQCGVATNCGPFEGNDDRYDEGKLFAQELRLSSSADDSLQWTVGVFYQEIEDQLIADYRTFDASSATPFVSIFTDQFYAKEESESYSVFADVSYQVTERFRFGLGGRYFEDSRDEESSCCLLLGVPVDEQSADFDSFDPRVYASFAIAEQLNLYASIGSGFRSGGFNSFGDPPYDSEDVLSYEVGIKGALESGFNFEVAGFYNDYSDMLRRGLLFNGTNFTSQLSNIGDVDIYGIEAGMSFRPVQNVTLSLTAAWLDAEVQSVSATDATSLPGDSLDYVPEFSASASAVFDFAWAGDRPGYLRVDYNYRDAVSYIDRTSFLVLPQNADDLSLVNARLGMQVNDAVVVELYGTNLTNENKWQDPYHAWRNANRTKPRTVGIELTYTPGQ
ncbi:MAG: TonB-dependent receptor [Pseudomonadota bacterium]